jgi:chemotaxis protein CheC
VNNLSPHHIDALKELINIGIGRAAGVLNEMTRFHVILQVPFVKLFAASALKEEVEELGAQRLAAVRLGFKGPFSGIAALVFPPDSASNLVAVLTGEEPASPDLDSVRAGTLSEVGNIVLNGVMGSFGNALRQRIDYSLPSYVEDSFENVVAFGERIACSPSVLLVRTRFSIQQLHIEGNIILFFELGSFDALRASIDANT